ncbi:MAG: [protein-PII] uridylyltransferase [Planctomycetota bacterium]
MNPSSTVAETGAMMSEVTFRPVVAEAAAAILAMRVKIAAQHAGGALGAQTAALASDECDTIVLRVWRAILADLPESSVRVIEKQVTVVAHGGYGRREMAPYSDIDLMLLYDPGWAWGSKENTAVLVADVAKRLLQDLFDAGMDVGQSVRTLRQATQLAASDATIYSTLIDARPLAGNAELLDRLTSQLQKMTRSDPRRIAERLAIARQQERDKYGQSIAMLEPNVKRSPGGLRDIQMVRWLGMIGWSESSFADLATCGAISRQDADSLRDAAEFLLRLRNDLHLAAGRTSDDLTRDEQLRITQVRGIESLDGMLGVERFMRDYFQATWHVAHVLENIQQAMRRPSTLKTLLLTLFSHRVDGLFQVGPVSVSSAPRCQSRVARNLASIMRLVELSMLYNLPIEHATWEAIRVGSKSLTQDLDSETKGQFLALFRQPHGLASALRRLHEAGLLEQFIPQFIHARHLMQFNNYHKYTVDEHCILAVERAVTLAKETGWLGTVWRQLHRKHNVLLALLIHDLGKGFVGDHSEVGAAMAREIAHRLGLSAEEGDIIEFLVRKHLAMAHLAFRRNLGDDSLVVRFACDVGSPEVLQMLAVLTASDTSAVGPDTWTRWKADLLGDLYFRTLAYLDGESPSVGAQRNRKSLEKLLADRPESDAVKQLAGDLPLSYLRDTEPARVLEELGALTRLADKKVFVSSRWQPETSTLAITVCTQEDAAPGVFHRLTGAMTAQRLEILSADIHTLHNGLVIDHFVVQDPDFTGQPPIDRCGEIAAAIRDSLKADHVPSFRRRWNPFAPLPHRLALTPVRVLFDNESSEHATIVEVFAHDSVGLLYEIAKTFFEANLSVRSAKIGTYLDQVVDAFHITDRNGEKVVDPDRLAAFREAIERVAAPLTGPGPPH